MVTPVGGLVYMCMPGLWVSLRYFAGLWVMFYEFCPGMDFHIENWYEDFPQTIGK